MRCLAARITACIAALTTLAASEYRGQVEFGGLPLAGATVTATQGNKTLTAVTDSQGTYTFPDLADGPWTLQAEKRGFTTARQDATVGSALPGALFEMKMLSLDEMETEAPPLPATASDTAPPPEPEITAELAQRAADGFLINGSAMNGASTPFAQARAFGNARRGGPRLYTYALSLVDSNSALNAANYSLTGQKTPKPPFNNLTGNASFAGPLRIPHLIRRNAPQLTLIYSRVENHATSVYTGLMPTAAERAGQFPGFTIPASRFSPQALSLLQFYPLPNFPAGGAYNYQVPLVANTHTDNFTAGVQESFKRRNTVTAKFALSDTRTDSDNRFNFLDETRSLGLSADISYRRAFTTRFFGTLTYQFSRQSNTLLPFFANRENVSGDAGIAGNNQAPLNWGPPTLQFNQSAIAGLSDGAASTIHNQTSALGYIGTWNRRAYNITFGGDFRWQQFNTISQSNPRGTFTFNGSATGFDFADFLQGTPDATAIAYGNADKYLRARQPDLFFQDDWRIAPGVTLNLGLRWEYTSPIAEKYGRLVNLDVAPGFSAVAPVVGNSSIHPDYHEIEPRVALAWRPFSASSMVLRAGYGISYNTQVYQPFANLMAQQSPLSTTLNIANSAATPLTLANGFYAPPNITTNTIAVDPNFRIGYAQVWNLIVQRDLPGALQMVATYTGTKGTHQLQAFAPNTYPGGTYSNGPANPSGYVYYTSGGNSSRESATVQLRRRLHNGLQAQLQYTYSKSIDDAALLGGGGLGSVAQNWLDLTAERSLSSFDQRHLANVQLQYTSGFGVAGGTLLEGWRGRLFKDWTVLDAINTGTGLPLNPVYAQLVPGTGIPGIVRPEYTGMGFVAPPPGEWGNAGRNTITGPAQFSMNASLARAFRLNDRFTLNLRFDSANPLNHVVFTGLNTTITSAQFGLPSSVNAMRTVTTNLRLTF
jgi:hypothetical protein